MRGLVITLVCVLLITPGVMNVATADETLDQAQEVTDVNYAFYQPQGCASAGVKGAAQTFTAGISGLLTRIELDLSKESWTTNAEGIVIEIHANDPTGALLATSHTIPAADVSLKPQFAWVSFTFAVPPTSVAGQSYAIVLQPDMTRTDDIDPTFLWNGPPPDDVYAGGVTWDYYCVGPGSRWEPYVFGNDRTFRTYVTTQTTAAGRRSWGQLKRGYR
jgi:hypothetical protein